MSLEAEYCEILPDLDGSVTKWVCDGLDENTDWVGAHVTVGIYLHGKIIGGIILNDIRPGRDVWLTIYTENKRWCCRGVLRCVFDLVFKVMNCSRCSIFVSKDNEASKNLVEKLGWKREGLLRQYRDNGDDCFVYGMLKDECIWRSKK